MDALGRNEKSEAIIVSKNPMKYKKINKAAARIIFTSKMADLLYISILKLKIYRINM